MSQPRRPAILIEGFRDFSQFLHANARIVVYLKIRPRLLPTKSFRRYSFKHRCLKSNASIKK
jgi:hypothetical protein